MGGCLLKGYKVKLLARKPEKVTKVLSKLFDADTLETYQENITVVAGGVMGRLTAWVIIPYMLKSCFDDLEASEKMIQSEWEQEDSKLTLSIIRAPVLRDYNNYTVDFLSDVKDYHILSPSDCVNIGGVFIDRQQVAGGFLDVMDSSDWDGKTVTVSKTL